MKKLAALAIFLTLTILLIRAELTLQSHETYIAVLERFVAEPVMEDCE